MDLSTHVKGFDDVLFEIKKISETVFLEVLIDPLAKPMQIVV